MDQLVIVVVEHEACLDARHADHGQDVHAAEPDAHVSHSLKFHQVIVVLVFVVVLDGLFLPLLYEAMVLATVAQESELVENTE